MNNSKNIEKHIKGYMFDSLVYRYQLARYKACETEVNDLMLKYNISQQEAHHKAKDLYERDVMRFIQILDEAIGEHD